MADRMSWKAKLDAIRRDLDPGAHLKFPDVYGNWYLSARVEVRDRSCWVGSGFNGASPASCIGAAWKAYTSGKVLLLHGEEKVTWDGRFARPAS